MLERKHVTHIRTGNVVNLQVEETTGRDGNNIIRAYLHTNKNGTPSRRAGHKPMTLSDPFSVYVLTNDEPWHKSEGDRLRIAYYHAKWAAEEAMKELFAHYGHKPK